MKHVLPTYFFILSLFVWSMPLYAQNPTKKGQKQYTLGKTNLANQKYKEARNAFLEVYKNPKNYDLRPNALFYAAITHRKEESLNEANDAVEKLLAEFPNFQAKDEALYLLAEVQLKQKATDKALKTLDRIENAEMANDIKQMKGHFLRALELNTLQLLLKKRPQDTLLAQIVADRIAAQSTQEQEVEFMEQLVEDLKLEKPATMRFERKILTKPTYKIAVLLPFDLDRMKSRDTTTTNRISVALYQGMRIAQRQLDTLKGAKVRLYAYEIGRGDRTKLEKLLKEKEFEDIDAFVGPVFDSLHRAIADILPTQKAILINPISLDPKMLVNSYTYLYESTLETQALKAVEFLASQTENKSIAIFFDDLKKHKAFAALVKQKAEEKGLKILAYDEVGLGNMQTFRNTLQRYNQYELGSLFIASSSDAVAEEVMKRLLEGGYNAPTLVPESWLRMQDIDPEQCEKARVHILYPEFLDTDQNKAVLPFKKAYAELTRRDIANNNQYAYVGYELAHHLTRIWSIAGTKTDYAKALHKLSAYEGKTGDWLQYTQGKQDNQFVPILRFDKEKGEWVIANRPK